MYEQKHTNKKRDGKSWATILMQNVDSILLAIENPQININY